MSTLSKIGEDMSGLAEFINSIENNVANWKDDLNLNGKNLRAANIEQPSLIAYYDQLAVEVNVALEFVDMKEKQIRGEKLVYIKDTFKKEYTDSSIQKVIDSDPKYMKIHLLYLEIKELHDKIRSIVDAFKQRAYVLNNLVKIHEKELENITINLNQ